MTTALMGTILVLPQPQHFKLNTNYYLKPLITKSKTIQDTNEHIMDMMVFISEQLNSCNPVLPTIRGLQI